MNNPINLTKSCLVCGASKPLAAFLQLTGGSGTLYGNVCSSCRGAESKLNEEVILNEDNRGSTSARLRIGADARNAAELADKKSHETREQLAREENDKREKKLTEKSERASLIEKNERKHREGYIDSKKKQFFSTPSTTQNKTPSQQSQVERAAQRQTLIIKEETELHTQQVENVQKDTLRNTGLDLSAPQINVIRGDEERYKSAAAHSFATFLGTSTALGKVLGKVDKQKLPEKKQKEAPIEHANQAFTSGKKR